MHGEIRDAVEDSFARQRLIANQFGATLFVVRRRTTGHAGGGGSVSRAPIWLRNGRQKRRAQAAFLSLRMTMKSSTGGGGNA